MNRAMATSDRMPTSMLMYDRGGGVNLAVAIAVMPAPRNATRENSACGAGYVSGKAPTPKAPIAGTNRRSVNHRAFKARWTWYAAYARRTPRIMIDALKIGAPARP